MGACFSSDDNSCRPAATGSSNIATAIPLSDKHAAARPLFVNGDHAAELEAEHLTKLGQQQRSLTEQQLQGVLNEWDKQHERQHMQLQQLIVLQTQEITTLRAQIIELQAHRQQQQIQNQRADYLKSQMAPAAQGHKVQIPQDCCAAAMACCFALEELRCDLKVEGQVISKKLDALSDSRSQAGAGATSCVHPQASPCVQERMIAKPAPFFTSQSTFAR